MKEGRYMCLICGEDYLVHQTIIEDNRQRCICLNCWANNIKKVKQNASSN